MAYAHKKPKDMSEREEAMYRDIVLLEQAIDELLDGVDDSESHAALTQERVRINLALQYSQTEKDIDQEEDRI